MGIYYAVGCDTLKERISFANVGNYGIKSDSTAFPGHPLGAVIIFALLNRWHGMSIKLINDSYDEEEYYNYTNVTSFVLHDYDEKYKTSYSSQIIEDDD